MTVEAAGINFPDALLVQGKYQVLLDPPFIPGNEIAGIVKESGENVGIAVGTKVIGLPDIGAFAEEIIFPELFFFTLTSYSLIDMYLGISPIILLASNSKDASAPS